MHKNETTGIGVEFLGIQVCVANRIFETPHFRQAISKLPFASVPKRVFVRTHSNDNDFDLHENGLEVGTLFHMNGFARRLVLKQRQRVTRKWPINRSLYILHYPLRL